MVNQDKIILYLETTTLPSWAMVNAQQVQQTFFHDDPEKLRLMAADKEVIVLVPAEDVLLTTINLPHMNRSRLLQALPYALEEQLIAEVDTLHFAVLQQFPDDSLAIAIVAKEKMQQWLTQLQTWQLQADRLLPISLALPLEEANWSVLMHDKIIVRTSVYQGFACDPANFSLLLANALATFPKPLHIQFYRCANTKITLEDDTVPITEKFVHAKDMLALLATGVINTKSAIKNNLLQGNYAVKRAKFPPMKKLGKIAVSLSISWLVLLFLYPIVSYLILNQRLHSLDAETRQIYQQQFPLANAMIAPRLRLEEKLQKLLAENDDKRFLLLLGQVGKGLAHSSGVVLNRIDFQNNQLTLTLSATSSDELTALTEFLLEQGLKINQQSANLIGSRINASLIIE